MPLEIRGVTFEPPREQAEDSCFIQVVKKLAANLDNLPPCSARVRLIQRWRLVSHRGAFVPPYVQGGARVAREGNRWRGTAYPVLLRAGKLALPTPIPKAAMSSSRAEKVPQSDASNHHLRIILLKKVFRTPEPFPASPCKQLSNLARPAMETPSRGSADQTKPRQSAAAARFRQTK